MRSFALYGDTTGETDEYGLPVRYPWAREYRGRATVVYGHTPTPTAEWVNNTICIDTGAVFGGSLTALRYPTRELVSVPAARIYYEPVRPADARDGGTGRTPTCSRWPTSPAAGRSTPGTVGSRCPAENAAAALELMGRFAIEPSSLLWLPPTMAPGSTSTVEGYLEHPVSALADYRSAGVDRRRVPGEAHGLAGGHPGPRGTAPA